MADEEEPLLVAHAYTVAVRMSRELLDSAIADAQDWQRHMQEWMAMTPEQRREQAERYEQELLDARAAMDVRWQAVDERVATVLVAGILALHRRTPDSDHCAECGKGDESPDPWPCATFLIIEEGTE